MFSSVAIVRAFGNIFQPGNCRKRGSRPASVLQRAAAVTVENLEQRAMFSATTHVGDLNGSATFGDDISAARPKEVYSFSMAHNGKFNADVEEIGVPLDLLLVRDTTDSAGHVHETIIASRTATPAGEGLIASLPQVSLKAGDYFLVVRGQGDAQYGVRLTADYAGGSLAAARDIGSATDATFQDFVGQSPEASKNDAFDLYRFKMETRGNVFLKMDLDDTSGTPAQRAHIQLIQDVNGDGEVDDGDLLQNTFSGPGASLRQRLEAGTYFVQVISDSGFSNYHLRVNADYAGGLLVNSRVMGSLDSAKSFNDFISPSEDVDDNYRFSVGSSRPLFLSLSESGGGRSRMSLYKDANNDGIPQASEFLVFTTANSSAQTLRSIDAGNYIVEVKALSGDATYTLTAEARPDAAGNTLKTAKNLGTVNGLVHRDDYVSTADPFDYYKFTTSANGKVAAQIFSDFDVATMDLIRDVNNNGIVDRKDVLTTSTPPNVSVQQLNSEIAAGTYFLRVRLSSGAASRYFLTLLTDYAGSTPATARNIGTIAGTKTFDDWASGDFGGPISDTDDVYKFSLSSTKTLSAKMAGVLSGQDLNLLLYRDKNNDGKLTANELVASSTTLNSPNEQITKSLSAGTYYLRVLGINGETNYHLSITAGA